MTWPLYAEASSKTADQEVGAGLTFCVLYIRRLAPRPCGTPYGVAVDGVPRLLLQTAEDVLVVGHEVGVDGRRVTGGDEAQGGVAGGGDRVVLAGLHQA